jgi:hypothetical protein
MSAISFGFTDQILDIHPLIVYESAPWQIQAHAASPIYGRLAGNLLPMHRIAVQAEFNKFSFGLFEIGLCVIIRIFRTPEFVAAFFQ